MRERSSRSTPTISAGDTGGRAARDWLRIAKDHGSFASDALSFDIDVHGISGLTEIGDVCMSFILVLRDDEDEVAFIR